MMNIEIKAFENSLINLINGVNLPATVKELVLDRVHQKVILASEIECRNEMEELKKGEEDGKEIS